MVALLRSGSDGSGFTSSQLVGELNPLVLHTHLNGFALHLKLLPLLLQRCARPGRPSSHRKLHFASGALLRVAARGPLLRSGTLGFQSAVSCMCLVNKFHSRRHCNRLLLLYANLPFGSFADAGGILLSLVTCFCELMKSRLCLLAHACSGGSSRCFGSRFYTADPLVRERNISIVSSFS